MRPLHLVAFVTSHVVPDKGTIQFKDKPLVLRSTQDALDAGIAIVMQETSLAADLTVRLVHVPTDYAQPWYDEAGGVYPAFHVFRISTTLLSAREHDES